ncbi:MAG: hypothetical protein K2X90_01395 [Candidatus Babeliaceae bacterium]|nr:hypothetical protein [Candidatus Babeliaceae bacterium]
MLKKIYLFTLLFVSLSSNATENNPMSLSRILNPLQENPVAAPKKRTRKQMREANKAQHLEQFNAITPEQWEEIRIKAGVSKEAQELAKARFKANPFGDLPITKARIETLAAAQQIKLANSRASMRKLTAERRAHKPYDRPDSRS